MEECQEEEGDKIMAMPVMYLMIVIVWAALFIGLIFKEYAILMLSAMSMLVLGIMVVINGIHTTNDLTTMAFGFFMLGTSFYILVRSSMEEMKG